MNPTALSTFFSAVFILSFSLGNATAEKLEADLVETAFSSMLTNATLKGSWAPITGGAQGDEQGDGYQIVSATKKEGDTWILVSKVKVNEKWMEFPMEMTVKFAGDTAVLILDEVPIWGGGTYSARVMFHNDVYAGSWWGGEQKGTISGTITRADKAVSGER